MSILKHFSLSLVFLVACSTSAFAGRNFNGTTSNYLDAQSPATLDSLSAFTQACWGKPSSLAGDEFAVIAKGQSSVSKHLYVGDDFGNSDNFICYVNYTTTDALARSANGKVVTTSWQYFSGTWAGGTAIPNIYYGTSVSSIAEVTNTSQSPSGSASNDSADKLIIGARDAGAGTVNIPFAGDLGYCHVYSRALALVENQQLAAFPGSIANGLVSYWPIGNSSPDGDYTSNANTATVNGTTVSTTYPPINGQFVIPAPGGAY